MQSSKTLAESVIQKEADYEEAVRERQRNGEKVKAFQNEQRIQYGRIDPDEVKQRQRVKSGVRPVESYEKLVSQRSQIKDSTNRVNVFTNQNEPAFINSMSRTMDAFDLRMSTFGGKQAEKANK